MNSHMNRITNYFEDHFVRAIYFTDKTGEASTNENYAKIDKIAKTVDKDNKKG